MNTINLKKAVTELANEHNAQYAEDCVKAFLKQKKITLDQYFDIMQMLYA